MSFPSPGKSCLPMLIAAAAAAVGLAQSVPAQAAPWASTAMPWTRLPSGEAIGALPQTIAIAPAAWVYAARSARLDAFAKTEPVILRLDVQVQSGSVGVGLVDLTGATLLSKEVPLKPANGATQIFFRIRPTSQPGVIVLRNYDAPGQAGSAVINAAQFVREADLTNDELADIVKQGLH